MQGIEILNTITLMEPNTLLSIVAFFCAVVGLAGVLLGVAADSVPQAITGSVLFLIFVVCLILLAIDVGATPLQQYEVIISPDTSITEIYDRYDVVEQRGEIWVLEDKK